MHIPKLFSKASLVVGGLVAAVQPFSGLAQEPFDLRQHYNWQIAICYHPMYLLVDQDRGVPIVGERVPPWGAATAEAYMERVKRNLAALEKDPSLRLNYEWSACELDDLSRRFPEVLRRMRAASERGQLDFLGGEFAQPHAVTLSSESCWRQFEFGLEVYQRLLGKRIVLHATQEPQLHLQLPQMLRRFGYKFMVMPDFPWSVTVTEGPFEFMGHEHNYFKRGDEFIQALGLDGTGLPAYFATNVRHTNPNDEQMKDFWSSPPVWIDFPDLEEFHNPLERWATPALLERALEERVKVAPPRAKGQVRTYQSYVEGVWAEELQRQNRTAEEAALLAGNLQAMARLTGAPEDRSAKLHDLWQTILKCQHHDISWIEVTDLRRKAIHWLEESAAESRRLTAETAAQLVAKDPGSVAVFNGLTHPREALLEVGAEQVLGGGSPFQKVGDRYFGFRQLPAGGFKSFPRARAGWSDSVVSAVPESIAAEHYRVELSKEGLIRQITTAARESLLNPAGGAGGEIRAVIGGQWATNRAAVSTFSDGPVCAVLERSGSFGPSTLTNRPGADWTKQGRVGGALVLAGESHLRATGLGKHDQLTIAMWIKPSTVDSFQEALLHTDGWETSGLHFILLKDGHLQAAVNGAEPADLFSKSSLVTQPGQWTHVAACYDATRRTLQLFVNGAKDNEVTLGSAGPVLLDKFRVGAWDREPRFFHGALDDVRIYAAALTEAEIAKLASGSAEPGQGLLAWWRLDEASGDLAADASGQGHPAAIARGASSGHAGGIPLRERYFFFKHQPVIKAELEFDFDGDEIGDFHIEESKLNVYYPGARSEIFHDVPFGCVPGREEEQLYAANWLYCGGLVYVNRGTPKHWVRHGVMANTLAWGGRRFSNRMHWGWTNQRQYDLRLYGKQQLEYFLIPAGAFDGPAITRMVESLTAPVCLVPGSGEKSFYRINDPSLAVTALFEKEGQAWARGYQMPSEKKNRFRDFEIFNLPAGELK